MGNTCKAQSFELDSNLYECKSINFQIQNEDSSTPIVNNRTPNSFFDQDMQLCTYSSEQNSQDSKNFPNSSWILPFKTDNVRTHYKLRKELTRGSTEVLRLCVDRRTGERLACKSLSKLNLNSKGMSDIVEKELTIFHDENFIRLRGVYEDRTNIHLVMEVSGTNFSEEGNDLYECHF